MAAQAGLTLSWSQAPEDRFSRDEAHIKFDWFGPTSDCYKNKLLKNSDNTFSTDIHNFHETSHFFSQLLKIA